MTGTRHSGQLDGNVALEVGEQGVFLNEYAIGKGADVFTEGSGRLIKAGTKINFQFHLHASGTETPTNVALGLKLYPKGYTPKHVITSLTVGVNTIDLRPHEADVRSDAYMPLIKPTRLLSFQPHMHNRGKAECLEAIYPSGKTEMLSCARFEFNWMRNYVYADDAAPLLPAGTVLHAIMWHDNSDTEQIQPRSGRADYVGRTNHRRDGLGLAELLLHVRRRLQKRNRRAEGRRAHAHQYALMAKTGLPQRRNQHRCGVAIFARPASPGSRRLPLERSDLLSGSPIPQGAGCKSHV